MPRPWSRSGPSSKVALTTNERGTPPDSKRSFRTYVIGASITSPRWRRRSPHTVPGSYRIHLESYRSSAAGCGNIAVHAPLLRKPARHHLTIPRIIRQCSAILADLTRLVDAWSGVGFDSHSRLHPICHITVLLLIPGHGRLHHDESNGITGCSRSVDLDELSTDLAGI